MRSGLLRHSITTLRLRADAPWPSQLTHRMHRWLRVRLVSGRIA